MRKKNILLIVVSSLVLLSLILQTPTGTQLNLQIIKPVKANPNTIWVPDNYTTIQEAINTANEGETIFVRATTYYEHVVVNKTVSLVGENPLTTIIDGGGTGIVVRSNAYNVEIRGFTIRNGGVFPDSSITIWSCIGNIVRDNIIRSNAYGVRLSESNGCSIINNTIIDNSWAGIHILDSSNNTIHENTIAKNSWGVWITSPSSVNNTLHHNNFIDNPSQAQNFGLDTAWDNGTEGNYWSDYTGIDTDGDGVGNTPHVTGLVTDNHPLIIPTRPFPVVYTDVIYLVGMLGNSTVSGFYFSWSLKEIGFYVNGPLDKIGFCNVTIPMQLLWDSPWTVWDGNGNPLSFIPTPNATHTSLYITYSHNIQMIRIIGTGVVTEFPAAMVLPLFIVVTLVAAVVLRKKKETFEL